MPVVWINSWSKELSSSYLDHERQKKFIFYVPELILIREENIKIFFENEKNLENVTNDKNTKNILRNIENQKSVIKKKKQKKNIENILKIEEYLEYV